jgi:hypothetical protein
VSYGERCDWISKTTHSFYRSFWNYLRTVMTKQQSWKWLFVLTRKYFHCCSKRGVVLKCAKKMFSDANILQINESPSIPPGCSNNLTVRFCCFQRYNFRVDVDTAIFFSYHDNRVLTLTKYFVVSSNKFVRCTFKQSIWISSWKP